MFSAFLHCIYNPNDDEFRDWMKAAERETWRYIPKIKSRVAVEMTLDKCVQQLRKQLVKESLQKKQAQSSMEMSNRVPSFFTSASLVNMSGHCITESHDLEKKFNAETNNKERSNSTSNIDGTVEIAAEVPTGWKGMGLRGNFSSGSLNRTGSGLFLIDGESEDEKSIAEGAHQNPGEGNEGTQYAGEVNGYIKTSSMANFYYQRRRSHSSLPEIRQTSNL